ncbi:MAG: hypothetical protein JNM52_03485 [Betaproteobacteria bacterium]|nr:hypothetical protein [Betaproteobacteria bacterium]
MRNRGGEVIEELPLYRVENQPYIHYRKGALVMYWLKEAVGVDTVNRALQKLLQQYAFKPAPYPASADFIRLLRAEAGPAHDQLITDLFEKITLYDMKASDAKATSGPMANTIFASPLRVVSSMQTVKARKPKRRSMRHSTLGPSAKSRAKKAMDASRCSCWSAALCKAASKS